MKPSERLLTISAALSFALALFQAVITSVPSWALYFGAGTEIVSRPWLLCLVGYPVAVLFAVFGFYALSGAGRIRRLPYLPPALVAIVIVFLLRGLILFPEILMNAGIIPVVGQIAARHMISSGVSLLIGMVYLAGTIAAWPRIGSDPRPPD